MISLISFLLASICNAIMDVCLFHWHKSIFTKKGFKRQFWDGTISWRNKYIDGDFNKGLKTIKILWFEIEKPVQITDAFHLFKTLMIAFIIITVITVVPIFDTFTDFCIYSATWVIGFNLFYNRILKLK